MSDKMELIALMLAKAEATTPAEAEALMEHAERLMIKYGIEQAQIDARRAEAGGKSEEIITKVITFSGTYHGAVALGVAAGVGYALGNVKLLQTKWSSSTSLHVIGFESDVKQAEILMRSLEVQAVIAMRDWWKGVRGRYTHYSTEYEKRAMRDEFIRGFGSGAASRIRESRKVVVQEEAADGTSTALVLVDRKARLNEYFDSIQHGKARRSSRRTYGTYAQGTAAGRNANTGGATIGARGRIGA